MERLEELMGLPLTLVETRNFHHKNLQESPLDVVFLQAKVNLQVVLKLGANLEVKWKQELSKRSGAFSSSFLLVSADSKEREERRVCCVKLLLEALRICGQKLCKSQLAIVRE